MSDPIFHITSDAEWRSALAAGAYRAPSLDDEGFIHASTATQVAGTAARYYAGRRDLVLLTIDPDAVTVEIRWEPSHDQLYPHLYGPLAVGAVLDVRAFDPDAPPELGEL
jgi:uncharacterized protein (DUF952 family)